MSVEVVDGLPVLDKIRTVLNCSVQYDFPYGLPIADSALRQGIGRRDLSAGCSAMRIGYAQAARVLRYADGASENGGESMCRAVMIDGRIAVGEYDGTQKYVDPQMTGRRSVQTVVQMEREREEALRRAGVSLIVRFTYDDVIERVPLVNKLLRAGIPRSSSSIHRR